MRHRTGVFAFAGLLALAVVTTASVDRDYQSTIPDSLSVEAPATVDSAPAYAPASPADVLTPLVQLVNVRSGVADSGRRVGFGQLVISFTRDSLQGRQELLAVIYLADTVRAERRQAVMQAVSLILLGEPALPGPPVTPATHVSPQRSTAQFDAEIRERQPWRTSTS